MSPDSRPARGADSNTTSAGAGATPADPRGTSALIVPPLSSDHALTKDSPNCPCVEIRNRPSHTSTDRHQQPGVRRPFPGSRDAPA